MTDHHTEVWNCSMFPECISMLAPAPSSVSSSQQPKMPFRSQSVAICRRGECGLDPLHQRLTDGRALQGTSVVATAQTNLVAAWICMQCQQLGGACSISMLYAVHAHLGCVLRSSAALKTKNPVKMHLKSPNDACAWHVAGTQALQRAEVHALKFVQ